MNLLEIKSLKSGYGKALILQDVSIEVEEGGFTAIIGPNGAGKTTLLRSIYGIADLYEGTVTFRGEDITELSPANISLKGVNYVPQDNSIFSSLTVLENLRMGATVMTGTGRSIEERLEGVYNRFPRLKDRQNQLGGTLSGGERQMLAISCALMTDPDLILLDEPSAGLQPTLVQGLFEEIKRIHDEGRTILIVEQNAKMALEYARKGYVLEGGRIKLQDDAKKLLETEEVIKHYLAV
ncbi:MAG: ATP-binding cassette domain-containing protein [Proteobacteria bacterium]|nr:ATP-binding cassette domain-containing protein [Pseudomonadota bacterium]